MYIYADNKQTTTESNKAVAPKIPSQIRTTAPNLTGIPGATKTRFENLSGFSFDDVRVHYNSGKPAQLQALAYTQGNQVHVAPGQEKHLAHELGRVIQQKQVRVRPTTNVGGVTVNDAPEFEREADHISSMPVQQMKMDMAFTVLQKMDADIPLNAEKPATGTVLENVDLKSFLLTLKDKIAKTADDLLSQINQTSDDCPYISKWFGFYADKDKGYLEKAIARFAPDSASANDIDGYTAAIVDRVRTSLQKHIRTGTIEDVPDELIDEQHDPQEPEEFHHMAEPSQPVAQLSRSAPPPPQFGRRNIGRIGAEKYSHILRGSQVVRPNQYIDDGGRRGFQLGWGSGVEFTQVGNQFQIGNTTQGYNGNAPIGATPLNIVVPNNAQGGTLVDSIVTRGVDTCTVIILSSLRNNQHAMFHLDGGDLNRGSQKIAQTHAGWVAHGGIGNITVSYSDDSSQADPKRVRFVADLRRTYGGIVTEINRGDKDASGGAHHSEIGLGFDNQNRMGLFGDFIHPDLRLLKYNDHEAPILDQIKTKTLDEIRTRSSNQNQPQNTKRITFEAEYQPGDIQTLATQLGDIRWE